MIEIRKRKCNKNDYVFVYGLVKKFIFPFVSKYVKPDKAIFDKRFFSEYKNTIILMRGKRRIGLYELKTDSKTLIVSRIMLSSAYHKKGIGEYLMRSFESMGYQKIQLMVWDINPAVGFYKKLGYKIVREENHKYLMEKKLK